MTHYDVLGVAPSADEAALRQAFVALARQHHPDVAGGDAARMRAINDAWATLGDPVRRAAYDRSLAAGRSNASTAPAGGPAWAVPDEPDGVELDDGPVRVTVALPRWISLVPAATFVTSVVAFGLGLAFASQTLLGLALMLFVLSCLFFLASPFVALFASRRTAGR